MSSDNVVPFRKRPPSEAELEVYRWITRGWNTQMRQMMFPEYFEYESQKRSGSVLTKPL